MKKMLSFALLALLSALLSASAAAPENKKPLDLTKANKQVESLKTLEQKSADTNQITDIKKTEAEKFEGKTAGTGDVKAKIPANPQKAEEEKKAAAALDNVESKQKEQANATVAKDFKPIPKAKEDPNRWNAFIMGAKGAIYGGLLGFVFGGPAGLVTFAVLGFAAAYFIKKMNDS